MWRRVEVVSTTTLHQLSAELEAAMGWFGGHLHAFEVGGTTYQLPADDEFGWRPTKDERRAALNKVLPTVSMKMLWEYDFGDGWEHDVVVAAIESPQEAKRYPPCVAGERACPPEDCGGVPGYEDLLRVLADPRDPEHEHMVGWAPPGFDAAVFDLVGANRRLRGR